MSLEDHSAWHEVLLHQEEALRLGLEDDHPVMVKSWIGSIKNRLRSDSAVRRDCLVAERGGWIKAGHGFNLLTADTVSIIGEGTPY